MGRGALDRAVDAALVDVCCGRVPRLPAGESAAEAFVAAVRYHRVAPLAQSLLRDSRPELSALLRRDRDRALHHHLRVSVVLAEFGRLLEGIPWLVFKGPALSELAHPVPGLRSYKDLDLLVAPAQLREAVQRLVDGGWNVIDSDDTLRSPLLSGEVRLGSAAQILLDLHWSMLVTVTKRRLFAIDSAQLLERRMDFTLGLGRFWTLGRADSLVHVCLHAALSGATKLVHLLDADQLARQVEDWDLVAQRARDWGATAQVAVVLARAKRFLGTPVPGDFDRRLGLPVLFSGTMSLVDRLWPAPRQRVDASIPRLVARAVRPGFLRSLGSVLRSLSLGVRGRVRPHEAKGPRLPAGPEAIDDYFKAVEAATRTPSPPS